MSSSRARFSGVAHGAASVLIAGALVLAGCAPAAPGGGAPPTLPTGAAPVPTLPAGVGVEIVQLRADVAPRRAQVQVTNESGETVEIGAVRVEDPRFAGPAVRVAEGRTSVLPPGRSVDVTVQLPKVDCDAPDDGATQVVLELVGDRQSAEVTSSAPDPLGFVAPLHARECLAQRLTDAATLAFTGFTASDPGAPAALQLTITPAGGEATIVGVQKTNLIDFAAATVEGAYALEVALPEDADGPLVVELPIVPLRCDPHAVQEDKRGTIFDVRVEVAGAPGEIELFVGEEMRGRILAWVARWCGFGG